MKNFEIILIVRDGEKIAFFEKAEADSLVELMAKLLLIIVKVPPKPAISGKEEDDIPF